MDDLKQLNLGKKRNPRIIFVSASLGSKEEATYFQLLVEYKDGFVWSYKKLPGLVLRIVVYHFVVRYGVYLIKQP